VQPCQRNTFEQAAQDFLLGKDRLFQKMNALMSSQPAAPRILIVDDDEMVRYILEAVLSGAGYQVAEAESGEMALQMCAAARFPLVLMDMFMPGMGGPEALQQIREQWPETRLVLLSGAPEELQDQNQLRGIRFFPKPFDNQELLRVVREELAGGSCPP
jgi:CheY-like chemotaxis protein